MIGPPIFGSDSPLKDSRVAARKRGASREVMIIFRAGTACIIKKAFDKMKTILPIPLILSKKLIEYCN